MPSQIERWFLRSAEYVGFYGKPKDRNCGGEAVDGYLWKWHGYLDDVRRAGRRERTGYICFYITSDCLVMVTVKEESGETVVELTQSRIPDDENHGVYVDRSYGRAFYLGNLKSVLEGGIDLRNKNVDIKNVINS